MDQKNISLEEAEKKSKSTNDAGDICKNNTINQTIPKKQARENGGPKGLEPTRYGDWEKRGRCIDF